MVRAGARGLEEGGGRDRIAGSVIDTDKSGGLGQRDSLRRDAAGGGGRARTTRGGGMQATGQAAYEKGPLVTPSDPTQSEAVTVTNTLLLLCSR